MSDRLRCRYSDCVEGHPTTNDEEQVTCPTCRRDLGLPLLDAHITGNWCAKGYKNKEEAVVDIAQKIAETFAKLEEAVRKYRQGTPNGE